MDPLIREKFKSIDVPLRVAASPRDFNRRIVDRKARTLFMIDVRSRRGRSRRVEFILLYCGDEARAKVIDADRRHRQVLLDVKEPETRMQTWRWDSVRGESVREEIVVPASHRRLLVGMDESRLFICPLKEKASSVVEAHHKLAPATVHAARHALKVKRQGEWFFLPVTRPEDLAKIEEAVEADRLEKDVGISAAGRPHWVERLVRIGDDVYAMGAVRHPDHRVLRLKCWHQVHGNTEDVNVRPQGMTWVD